MNNFKSRIALPFYAILAAAIDDMHGKPQRR
jgi:hypothetical protein